jgi:hypothetical protein
MTVQQLLKHIHNFDNYLTTSKQIATAKQRHRVGILLRMIACRVLFHQPAIFYGLYNLDDRRIAEWAEFLTKDDMDKLQQWLNPAKHTDLVNNKLLFYERCLTHQIPTPPILGVLPVAALHLPDGIPEISTEEDLHAFFLKHQGKRLVFKTVDGSYGAGLLSIMLENGQIFDHRGAPLTVHDVFKYCHDYRSNFLIQTHLAPHPQLIPLMPGLALGTFRLVTLFLRKNQTVVIPYAFAKVPRRDKIVDNFKHGDTGNLLCRVDVENGKMMDGWGKHKGALSISRIDRHPDTLLVFREFTVPCWPEVLALVRRAAWVFSELPTLGWDVAITDQGIMVLEANWHYDPDGPQITLDRGIKSEIKALYRSAQSQQA